MEVDIKEAFIIETWLKYRYDKLFVPIKYTTEVPHPKLVNYEENEDIFGGTLQGGRKGMYDDFPNGCVYYYRSAYNIRTALLDYRPTDKPSSSGFSGKPRSNGYTKRCRCQNIYFLKVYGTRL